MMRRRFHPDARNGLTLLELLAVIVLLAMIAGTLAVNLATVDESASLRASAGQWQEMDRRARLLARTGQSSTIIEVHQQLQGSTLITLRQVGSDDVISRLELAPGTSVDVEPVGTAITFSRSGASIDYGVRLQHADTSSTIAWSVHGLTGHFDVQPEAIQ